MKFETKLFTILGTFFVTVVSVNIIFIYTSVKSYDGLVEENYYQRGLNYQEQITSKGRQEMLGWQFFTSTTEKGKKLVYTLEAKDKNGKAISDGSAEVTFFRPTQSGFDKKIVLTEAGNGIYRGEAELPLQGVWDIHIDFKKNRDIWKKKERITIVL